MKRILPLLLLCVLAPSLQAQTTTQTFNLQAGWNSIWLEVNPTDNDVSAVFDGLPLEAVWTFQRRLSAVDYIQNVNEPLWNRDQWLVHAPSSRVEAINNDLFAVFGLRAYLVKLTAPATLNVTGRPVLREVPWVPDAYNLRGYPIDPAVAPTFNNFFRHSSAHYNTVSNRMERVYRLNASGTWVLAGPGEFMQRGVAYWTYCRGNSDYQAPLMLGMNGVDGLEFGRNVDDILMRLINRTGSNSVVTVRDSAAPTPLVYGLFNPTTGLQWLNLPSPLSTNVGGGADTQVRLAVRRGALSVENYGSLLEIRNGTGTRWLVPLAAQRQPQAVGAARYAGLWAGNVTVNGVSQAHSSVNSTTPTPSGGDFSLRLLLHVDNSGATRLLREVIQLRQAPTTTNSADGLAVQATGERFILVTDERLIPSLTGSVLRDGELVGRRLSTAGFDFPTSPEANFLRLTGEFGSTNTVTGAFAIGPTFSRNPFLHRYHPDHDNLNEAFNGFKEEAFNVTRAFELRFSTTNLVGVTSADYGYRQLSGTYRETVTGINKSNVFAGGIFRLTRVAEIGVLNQ